MTIPAAAIKNEIQGLIQAQIETFGQTRCLTSSELSECHFRAERIRLLGQELDRIGQQIILEQRFGKAA